MNGNVLYTNPPIKEAIFVVSLSNSVDATLLDAFRNNAYIKQHYPIIKPTYNITIDSSKEQEQSKPLVSNAQDGFSLECGTNCKRLIRIKNSQIP